MCTCVLSHSVQQFVTPWTVACQALQALGFSRQEYWSESPFPPPRDSPNSGTWIWVPMSPALQVNSLLGGPSGKISFANIFPYLRGCLFALFRVYCVLSHLVLLVSCNPNGYSLLGSSIQVLSQARIQEWVIISFSRGYSQRRDHIFIGKQVLYHWANREAKVKLKMKLLACILRYQVHLVTVSLNIQFSNKNKSEVLIW